MYHYIIALLVSCMVFVFPFSAHASSEGLSESEKAKLFNQVMDIPVWVEKTVGLSGRTIEKGRDIAIFSSELDARRIFRERIVQTDGLNLTKDMIDFSELVKVTEEDTTGNYGKPYQIEKDGNIIMNATFRFKMKCEKVREINPFVKKLPYNRPSIIKEFKETDDYWEIVAVGYGFYESFEDIDSKIKISSTQGIDSACDAIINKVAELGITDKEMQEKIIKSIKAKKNYGGVYRVLGCGVELDAHVPIRINKKDASVSFIYN